MSSLVVGPDRARNQGDDDGVSRRARIRHMHHVFEITAKRWPSAVAVECGDWCLSYRDLGTDELTGARLAADEHGPQGGDVAGQAQVPQPGGHRPADLPHRRPRAVDT